MRFASESIEPIAQRPVKPFHMHRASRLQACSQRGADLHREQASMLIAMLDRLRQCHGLWDDPWRTPSFARGHRLSIRPHKHAPIAVPSITEPVQFAPVGSLHSGGHRVLDEVLVQRASGAGNHEATVSVLDEASPAFSFVRLPSCAVFFCTHDQNSSISTWLRCKSLASTCVRASA
jgi:hypothetical protein